MAALNEPVCLPKVKTAVVSRYNGTSLCATVLCVPIVTLTCVYLTGNLLSPLSSVQINSE